MKLNGVDWAECVIRQNQVKVAQTHLNPDTESDAGFYTTSTSTVIHLAYGDIIDVYCRNSWLNLYKEPGHLYNTFSGFLNKAD